MEKQEVQKRKYKKHKEDYKITIIHKLNTTLKFHTYGDDHSTHYDTLESVNSDIKLYPFYIEIRVKRQRAFFKSSITAFASIDKFEALLQNPILNSLCENERAAIEMDLKHYIAIKNDEFIISEWLRQFRDKIWITSVTGILQVEFENQFRELIVSRNMESLPFVDLIYEGEPIKSMLNLALILDSLGVESLRYLIEIGQSYFRLRNNLLKIKSFEWISKSKDINIGFNWLLSIDDVIGNKCVIDRIADVQNLNVANILKDLEVLSKFKSEMKSKIV